MLTRLAKPSGQVLAFNGSKWLPASAPPADISGSSLQQLSDVDTDMDPTDGQILYYDDQNNEWTAGDPPDSSDVDLSAYALKTDLTQETTDRTSADTALQGQITQEISDRAAGDQDLQDQIDALGDLFTYMGTIDATAAYPTVTAAATGHVYANTGRWYC